MTYKVIFEQKEYTDMFGKHDASSNEVDIPYEYGKTVWYCRKKRNKYVVRESKVKGIWATNMVGVTLDNNWNIDQYEFCRLFKDENEAIEWCLKQNQRGTVKVYRRDWLW